MTRTLRPRALSSVHAFLALVLALSSVACATFNPYAPHPCDRPDLSGCVVEGVGVVGNRNVPDGDIKEKIATAESSHALAGVFENIPILSLWDRLTVDYERLDPFVLERDLARVERFYRARGYYEAHARAGRVLKEGTDRVRVEVVVDEGEPVLVGKVSIVWEDGSVPPRPVKAAVERAEAREKRPKAVFTEADFESTKKRMARAMTSRGYAHAAVEGKGQVDLLTHRADITYTARLGPPCTFGPITIQGLGELPEQRLRAALGIKEGQVYSSSKLQAAEAALSSFGVLGSADAVPDLGPPDRTVIPVVFQVTPTPLKTAKVGGGAELGSRIEAHLVFGWENKNFFGGLRRFSIEAKPAAVFYPYTLNSLFSPQPDTFHVLPELRVHSELTQPGFIEARTRGLVNLSANVYRLITGDVDKEIVGYLEFAGKTGMEREFWDRRVSLGLYFNFQNEQPFSYRHYAPVDPKTGFQAVNIPYAQALATLDMRNGESGKPDPVNPHSGFYFSTDMQGAWIDAQDLRIKPELRGYIPIAKHVTLAVRVATGFLIPLGGALKTGPTSPPADPAQASAYGRYLQILQFRGFYSGGTNSNRGYGYNGVGPHEIVTFVSPTLPNGSALPIATGGVALWESSLELRFPIFDKLGAALFLDGSDVTRSVQEMNLKAPHLSTGLGLRYKTPVGPFRVDIGVRIPGAQVFGVNCPVFDQGAFSATPPPPICDPSLKRQPAGGFLDKRFGEAGAVFGLPLALSLAIGESF